MQITGEFLQSLEDVSVRDYICPSTSLLRPNRKAYQLLL